jgi:zinc transporter ZupT
VTLLFTLITVSVGVLMLAFSMNRAGEQIAQTFFGGVLVGMALVMFVVRALDPDLDEDDG